MSDSSVSFRSVMRGYDPAQVDHHMYQLAQAAASVWQVSEEQARQIAELQSVNSQLKSQADAHAQRNRELEAAHLETASPTYTGLGERISSVLTLVDNEAYELRTRAQADAANSLAVAEEHSVAVRRDADEYAMTTRNATDDEASQILEAARQQKENLLEDGRHEAENLLDDARQQAERLMDEADRQVMARQDAERQAMARREEAEAAYEHARARAAAAAVDFETTLASRREASALEFAAQVTAAEHQLTAIRLRADQARGDSERAQQEAAAKIAEQLEQATVRARAVVAEAKTKAERIRENSERELVAATQRRDSINAQLSDFRHELADLGRSRKVDPTPAQPAADTNETAAEAEHEAIAEMMAEVEAEVEAEMMAEVEADAPAEAGPESLDNS